MISGFRHEVAENCAILGYYTASSGNFLPTFWDILLVLSSGFKNDCLGNRSGNYGVVVETLCVCNSYFFGAGSKKLL